MPKIRNKFITVDSSFDINSQRLINVADPVEDNDSVNRGYLNNSTALIKSTISAVQLLDSNSKFVFCVETARLYKYDATSGETADNDTILNTADGGSSRFVSIAPSEGGATPAGSDGYIQYNDSGALGASANLTYISDVLNIVGELLIGDQTAEASVDIKSQGNTINTTHTRLINSLENVLLQIYDDGIVKITQTEDIPAAEAGFGLLRLDSGDDEYKLVTPAGQKVLSLDKLIDQLDVIVTNLKTGDLLAANTETGEWNNVSSEEYTNEIYRQTLNIDSDQKLTIEVPAGYEINQIVIEPLIADVDINLGTTSSGTEILSAFSCVQSTGKGFHVLKYSDLIESSFSLTNSTELYISSSAWTTSQLNITFKFTKLI